MIDSEIDAWIAFLNSLLELDRKFITQLIEFRLPCNQHISSHPTVQVMENGVCGMLGVLNGYFGVDANGVGHICAEFDDTTGQIIKFRRTKI